MHIPKTYLSLHSVTGVQVTSGAGPDRPLYITIDGEHGCMQIALFLQPLLTADQVDRLAEAMTAAMRVAEPAAVVPCPEEKAAYEAACRAYCDNYDANLQTDLNRTPIGEAQP